MLSENTVNFNNTFPCGDRLFSSHTHTLGVPLPHSNAHRIHLLFIVQPLNTERFFATVHCNPLLFSSLPFSFTNCDWPRVPRFTLSLPLSFSQVIQVRLVSFFLSLLKALCQSLSWNLNGLQQPDFSGLYAHWSLQRSFFTMGF